jgi:hypothetical protein
MRVQATVRVPAPLKEVRRRLLRELRLSRYEIDVRPAPGPSVVIDAAAHGRVLSIISVLTIPDPESTDVELTASFPTASPGNAVETARLLSHISGILARMSLAEVPMPVEPGRA